MRCHAVNTYNLATLQPVSLGAQGEPQLSQGEGVPPGHPLEPPLTIADLSVFLATLQIVLRSCCYLLFTYYWRFSTHAMMQHYKARVNLTCSTCMYCPLSVTFACRHKPS